jgi:hypothetical protein
MQLVGAEIGKWRVVLVEAAVGRVAEQHAAAAVGLQTVLVRIDDDGIDITQVVESGASVVIQLAGKREVTTIGCIGMNTDSGFPGTLKDGRQWIDVAKPRCSDGCNDGANVAAVQQFVEVGQVHVSFRCTAHGRERNPEHVADACVGIVRLLRGDDALARM